MMSSLLSKKTLSEIVRAKNKLIEKERAEFHRFRQLLAQEDMEVYLRVVRLWEQEQEDASS